MDCMIQDSRLYHRDGLRCGELIIVFLLLVLYFFSKNVKFTIRVLKRCR
jgi:hypothetical protein